MPESSTPEVGVAVRDVRTHPAVRALRRLSPRRGLPTRIEVLKNRSSASVYRLVGAGPDGAPLIAKRCSTATGSVERLFHEVLMPRLPLPSIRWEGVARDPEGASCWVFMEDAG